MADEARELRETEESKRFDRKNSTVVENVLGRRPKVLERQRREANRKLRNLLD